MADIQKLNVNNTTYNISTTWAKVTGKPSTFPPESHTHSKITHTLWNYNNAISDTTSPADICANFNINISGEQALFPGIVQNSTGVRYQSLFWTGYGAAGLVELSKRYGSDGRLKYRVSEGWSDNGAHWAAAGYRELANIEDLTWTNIESKPTTIAGYGIADAYTKTETNNMLSGYLPLGGGTISTTIYKPLTVENIASDTISILFKGISGDLGYLAFIGVSNPVYMAPSGYAYSLLHADNFNSYAPTLTGTGATGTWGISISGNAATATKLATPRTLWGQSFDGTSDINGDIIMSIASVYNSKISTSTSGLMIESWQEGVRYLPIMLNQNSGNVLIGTTTDNGSKLQTKGNIDTFSDGYYTGVIGFNRKSTTGGLYNTAYNGWQIHNYNGNLQFFVERTNGGVDVIAHIAGNSGNILIGTTTDNGYKLQVNGSERVYGNLIVDGEVSALVA